MIMSFAQIPQWCAAKENVLHEVFDQSALEVIDSIKPGPSKNRHGYRELGTVPVDTSELINSQTIEKTGSGYVVEWGTDHAYINHFGGNGMEGTFWITIAATGWQDIVAKNVKRAEAIG